MYKIILYEEIKNQVNTAFAKDGYAVYGGIGKEAIDPFSKEEILQVLYREMKSALEYEANEVLMGRSPSIPVDMDDYVGAENFVPEEPKAYEVIVSGDFNIIFEENDTEKEVIPHVLIKDQYGSTYTGNVTFSRSLIFTAPIEEEVIPVIAYCETASSTFFVTLTPYVAPSESEEPIETTVNNLAEVVDTMLGV